jgi:TRAP-type transport system periplasmic protein
MAQFVLVCFSSLMYRRQTHFKEDVMKKNIFIVTCVLFLTILFIGTNSVCAAPDKPIELKFSLFLPLPHRIIQNVYIPWIKQVEERAKGKVKITIYAGQTLGAAKDQYDLVLRGIADMTTHVTGYTPGRFPLTDVMSLPLNMPSAKIGARVIWELYEKYLNKEYQNVKLLMISTHEPGQLLMGRKPVSKLAELKGMRIRNGFPVQIPILKEFGATALAMSVPDTYDAMQKGMADGTWTGASALQDFKLIEVTKSHTILNATAPLSVMVMNLDKWKSLPPDVQKAFDELSGLSLGVAQATEFDHTAQEALEAAKAKGQTIYELTPAERKEFDAKVKPICEAWAADMDKKGLPGKAVYQEAVKLLEKYSK